MGNAAMQNKLKVLEGPPAAFRFGTSPTAMLRFEAGELDQA